MDKFPLVWLGDQFRELDAAGSVEEGAGGGGGKGWKERGGSLCHIKAMFRIRIVFNWVCVFGSR